MLLYSFIAHVQSNFLGIIFDNNTSQDFGIKVLRLSLGVVRIVLELKWAKNIKLNCNVF